MTQNLEEFWGVWWATPLVTWQAVIGNKLMNEENLSTLRHFIYNEQDALKTIINVLPSFVNIRFFQPQGWRYTIRIYWITM